MAIRRTQNWLAQQRADVDHLKSIESAVRNDFDELVSSIITGDGRSFVVRGLKIEMSGSIGSSANGLQLIVENSAFLHGNSDESGTIFSIASGAPNQVLSSTTNTKIEGAFTPSALNYVSIEFVRQVDDSTSAPVYLWNPTTKTEVTKTLPLAQVLDYKIVISSSPFASNLLPIAIVETDGSNNVISVEDRRNLLYRLGTAGANTPNPFYQYPWSEGRVENFYKSSTSSVSPFEGGDKQIENSKDNDDAIKTELRDIKGTQYWSSPSIGGSIAGLRYDLANTIMTGRGSIEHDAGDAGVINWDEDIYLTVLATRIKYKLEANSIGTDIDLDDKQVAYIKIVRNVEIIPQLIYTNGSPVVTSVGAIPWTAGLESGDLIKIASSEDTSYYEILSVDSTTQVTLVENYGGVSTGILGADSAYAWGNYRVDPAPSTDRHIKIANIEDMPFDKDVFWLFFRDDNAGISRIYVRFLNAELKQGETLTISDQVPHAVLEYMGSSSDSDSDPNYNALATGAKNATENYNSTNGENLTNRLSKITSMMADKAQDKTVTFAAIYSYTENTTNGLAQELEFFHDTPPELTVFIPSSADNTTIGLGDTLSLLENQAAYFSIDRNSPISLADLTDLTVSDIEDVPLNENVFIFAIRGLGTSVFLWNGSEQVLGTNLSPAAINDILNENAYDEPLAVVAGAPANSNEVTGPIAPNAILTLPNDSRDGSSSQGYVVGQGALELFLNGQYLNLGEDWAEVGGIGTAQTTFEILIDLEVEDVLTCRIDTAGGYVGVGGGGSGETNTASNVGAEFEVFKQKVGVDFQFRTLEAGTNVTITQNADTLTINSTGGSSTLNTTTVSTDTLLTLSNDVVLVDATSGTVTLDLPAAATANGKKYYVKKIDASVNAMIIDPNAAELIDGNATDSTTTQYESFIIICNGTGWFHF